MKKTVIIAILLAYVASILAVQFFGLKVVEIAGNGADAHVVPGLGDHLQTLHG